MIAHEDQILRMLVNQSDYWHDRDVIRSVTGLWTGHVDAALMRMKVSGRILSKHIRGPRDKGIEEVYTVPGVQPERPGSALTTDDEDTI